MNEQIAKGLELLAAKLGVGAEVLWGALVRQAAIDSACSLIIGALTVLGGYFYFKKLLPWAQRNGGDNELGSIVATILGGVVLLLFSVALVVSLDVIVAGFINPDYWALKQILSAVKSK